MGDGRDELSKARFWSGISRDSCCRRRAVLLWEGLDSVGEESVFSERDKAGLISSAVAILGIVVIVETVNGYFGRFTAPFDLDSSNAVSVLRMSASVDS